MKKKWVMLCDDTTFKDGEIISCEKETHTRCCLCENACCDEHMNFVREDDGVRDYVCEGCYQTCMEAYEHKQNGQNNGQLQNVGGQ